MNTVIVIRYETCVLSYTPLVYFSYEKTVTMEKQQWTKTSKLWYYLASSRRKQAAAY